ncbi:type IV pilus modification protein PilV [Acinetobacter sichuanensis]|uniref:type IV pilus modification protein PilV n=1 Tax=Acinetobacter sichuanensis TaxID=2136183 RepID=UPI00280D5C7F|nr:type IV pilus modification protein PilV [Acinetobacter sichuanensis]MDQ9020626.1 type IV pilus modification protein PilV [Acinetobacter sichuanensis]
MLMIDKNQQGVGLVEVLVALLILAIGVMGFIALQYRAIEATTESGARIQAVNLARDLAERMRVNRGAEEVYAFQLNTANTQRVFPINCFNTNCSSTNLADFDVAQIATKARTIGMTANYLPCQGNEDNRRCIYVAWGDTAATDGTDRGNCTTGTSYEPNSTCLIMEVY